MKQIKVVLCGTAAAMLSACQHFPMHDENPVTVDQVIVEVERTVAKVKEEEPSFSWTAIEVSLQTVSKDEKTVEGGVWVLTLGASNAHALTQTVEYTLGRPHEEFAKSVDTKKQVSDVLAATIVKAIRDMNAVSKEHSKTFAKGPTSVSMEFGVEHTTSANAEAKLVPISLKAGHSSTVGWGHSIKITF